MSEIPARIDETAEDKVRMEEIVSAFGDNHEAIRLLLGKNDPRIMELLLASSELVGGVNSPEELDAGLADHPLLSSHPIQVKSLYELATASRGYIDLAAEPESEEDLGQVF